MLRVIKILKRSPATVVKTCDSSTLLKTIWPRVLSASSAEGNTEEGSKAYASQINRFCSDQSNQSNDGQNEETLKRIDDCIAEAEEQLERRKERATCTSIIIPLLSKKVGLPFDVAEKIAHHVFPVSFPFPCPFPCPYRPQSYP